MDKVKVVAKRDRELRMRSFDQTTKRHRRQSPARKTQRSADRGWTRDDLYSRRTELGLALEQSAKEILAHVKGDARLHTRRIVLPDEVDVKRIRTKVRKSLTEQV